MRGRYFSIYSVINLTDGLPPHLHRPDRKGRPLGLRDSTPGFAHDHFVPVSPGTITRSSPTWGRVERTSRGCWYPTSACGGRSTTLARGSRLSALARVDGCPPWFRVDPCLLPPGAGWVLSGRFPEAPVAGVSVWTSLSGRGLPLGWASGVLGIGCLWRWGTRWIRPCWTTLQ